MYKCAKEDCLVTCYHKGAHNHTASCNYATTSHLSVTFYATKAARYGCSTCIRVKSTMVEASEILNVS